MDLRRLIGFILGFSEVVKEFSLYLFFVFQNFFYYVSALK